ncbi:hypothetical protein GCM10010317_010780 [Streptomyces mirabilis]|nr:hypothetical protein GCM10010317_010780 [Streptomyces mirabilis]
MGMAKAAAPGIGGPPPSRMRVPWGAGGYRWAAQYQLWACQKFQAAAGLP